MIKKLLFIFFMFSVFSFPFTYYLPIAFPPSSEAELLRRTGLSPIPYLYAYPPSQADGRIIGRVSNRTRGGILMPGLEVFLEKYVNQNLSEKVKTVTDAEGYFQFSNLPVTPEHSYRVLLDYQGISYSGHPFSFREGENLKTIEMGVYESTDNAENIRMQIKHIIIEIEENVFKITEALRLENSGNKTFLGPLRFSLPKGFTELKYERGLMSCCLMEKEDGFLEKAPFYPGYKEVTYSYQIKYKSSHYLFSSLIDYPIDNLDLIIRDLGLKLESKNLVFIGPVQMGEKKFLRLSARGLDSGENVEIKISGLPVGPERYRIIVLFLAGLVVLFGFVYPFVRKKREIIEESVTGESVEIETGKTYEERKKELIKAIAELDDWYAEGKIDAKEYQKLRLKKKKILINLIKTKTQ